jgi:hypothetical protein
MNEVTLLTANLPDRNGRIFSKELLESIAIQINENQNNIIGFVNRPSENEIQNAAFLVSSAHLEEDELKAEINFLETSFWKTS